MDLPTLRLKLHEDRRIGVGHLWIFSNEVDTEATPLQAFEPGQSVIIRASSGKALGVGYVNPNTLICGRVVSRDIRKVLSADLIERRMRRALALRERLYAEPFYRVVYGESDDLPGLTVDRYGELVVGQITTAGMEVFKDQIAEVIAKVLQPKALLWRNDARVRDLERLDRYVEVAFGEVSDTVEVREGGLRALVSPTQGQKTGWFYDQRLNRERAAAYAKDSRVLDLFAYVGGWGLRCALAGAREVVSVDASPQALDLLRRNVALNGLEGRVSDVQADAFDFLKSVHEDQRFDLAVLDPPAFIKRKKDARNGEQAYLRLNRLAIEALADEAILVSCSCSYHMKGELLSRTLLRAATQAGRRIQILEHLSQAPDHPVHAAIPETAYLKGIVARVWR
jgi:23S rRNA (cytosine1962-C5)-methyltransferase